MELQSVNLNDVSTAFVEESSIMRHHDACDRLEGINIILHPSDVNDIWKRGKKIIADFYDTELLIKCVLVENYPNGSLVHRAEGYLLFEALRELGQASCANHRIT